MLIIFIGVKFIFESALREEVFCVIFLLPLKCILYKYNLKDFNVSTKITLDIVEGSRSYITVIMKGCNGGSKKFLMRLLNVLDLLTYYHYEVTSVL